MKDDRFYLQTILAMIGRIEQATSDKTQFFDSVLHQDATLRNLHTMTETTQRLSDELKAEHSDIEWRLLSAFRNVLVHDYLGIDIQLIWRVAHQDVPRLKKQIEQILQKMSQHGAE